MPWKLDAVPRRVAKEHGQVFPRGVIHRDYQVPAMVGYPFMVAGILMHHHAGQRFAVTPQTVLATRFGAGDCASLLQLVLDPRIAALPTVFAGIPGVEMFDVPADVVATVEVYQPDHFVNGGTLVR